MAEQRPGSGFLGFLSTTLSTLSLYIHKLSFTINWARDEGYFRRQAQWGWGVVGQWMNSCLVCLKLGREVHSSAKQSQISHERPFPPCFCSCQGSQDLMCLVESYFLSVAFGIPGH